jgi:hypothetical protein
VFQFFRDDVRKLQRKLSECCWPNFPIPPVYVCKYTSKLNGSEKSCVVLFYGLKMCFIAQF